MITAAAPRSVAAAIAIEALARGRAAWITTALLRRAGAWAIPTSSQCMIPAILLRKAGEPPLLVDLSHSNPGDEAGSEDRP